MYQFGPDLQLPKAKTKMPWATAECDKIPKMGKIICFWTKKVLFLVTLIQINIILIH